MRKERIESLKKIDIWIFTFLSILCEFLSSYFFDILESGFYLSFAFLILLIMTLRWGAIGIIPFVLSGIPSIIMDKNLEIWQSILFYMVANAFAVIPILVYKKAFKGKDRNFIIKKPLYLLLYSFLALLSLALGKGIACLIINQDFSAMAGYLVSMIFTFVLAYLILYGLSKLKNTIVMDMDVYIDDGKEV